jgi:hypothetical protein
MIDPLHVKVDFGKDIPHEIQGAALLQFERHLRQLSAQHGDRLWIEVFKDAKGDDSKLRVMMTKEERQNL